MEIEPRPFQPVTPVFTPIKPPHLFITNSDKLNSAVVFSNDLHFVPNFVEIYQPILQLACGQHTETA